MVWLAPVPTAAIDFDKILAASNGSADLEPGGSLPEDDLGNLG